MEKKYITYVLLDSSVKGKFVYSNYTFNYEPIYVGAGSPNRIKSHMSSSYTSSGEAINEKLDILRRSGYVVGHEIIKTFLSRENALKLEKKLINIIGMRPNGPLFNMKNGYCLLGPYIAIDPVGNCFYIEKGKLNEFSKEHETSNKSLLNSARKFNNTGELKKGYLKAKGKRKAKGGYGWACIEIDKKLGNTDVYSFTKQYLKDVGIDFDDFIKIEPTFGFQESRILKAAIRGAKESDKANLPLTDKQKKHLSKVKRIISAKKYGFDSIEDVKVTFNHLHHAELKSASQIAKMFKCSQCYVLTNIDIVISKEEMRAKRYGFDSMKDATLKICEVYDSKMTYADLARKFSCGVEFARARLNECAVETIESL